MKSFPIASLLPLVLTIAGRPAHAQVSELWRFTSSQSTFVECAVGPSGEVAACGMRTIPPSPRPAVALRVDAAGANDWRREYAPNPGPDEAAAIGISSTGITYCALNFAGPTSVDVRLVGYDAAGNLVVDSGPWDGGASDGIGARRLAFDSQGNVYAAGGTELVSPPGAFDALVVSWTPAGTLRWVAGVDGGAGFNDAAVAITIDATDAIYITGQGNDQPLTGPFGSILLARLTTSGTTLWVRDVPLPNSIGVDVGCDRLGNVFVCGSWINGPLHGVLAKWDAFGNMQWSRVLGGTLNETFAALAVDRGGRPVACGWRSVPGPSGTTSIDALTIRFDDSGGLTWERLWASSIGARDFANDVAVDAAGAVTVGISSDATVGVNDRDMLVVRWDAGGTARWEKRIVQGIDLETQSLYTRADGSLVLGGRTRPQVSEMPRAFLVALADQSVPLCIGDGLDVPCPCGNSSAAGDGQGCANHTGVGARLSDSGLASLGADTLVLHVDGIPPATTCLFFQGDALQPPAPFGDGLLCAGGRIVRLFTKQATSGVARAPDAGDTPLSARSAQRLDPLAPGSARVYQVFYRDSQASFCPPGGTTNASGALRITWGI